MLNIIISLGGDCDINSGDKRPVFCCVKDKKSFSKLVEHIKQFLEDYNDPDKLQDYKAYCQSSTTSSENVRGRLDYWRGVIREL